MGTEFLKIKECDEAIDIIQNLFDENLKPQSEESVKLMEEFYLKMFTPEWIFHLLTKL